MLSVTLNNVDTELQENREKIKILTENNKALTLKVDTLSKNIDNYKVLNHYQTQVAGSCKRIVFCSASTYLKLKKIEKLIWNFLTMNL